MMNETQITEKLNAYLRGEWPPEVAIATAPRLENWKVVIAKSVVAGAYEMRINGTCTGHPGLPAGPITTSPVLWIDPVRCLAHTMSRLYVLENEGAEPVAW